MIGLVKGGFKNTYDKDIFMPPYTGECYFLCDVITRFVNTGNLLKLS